MGILDRFTSIVKANINELLDKAEDPQKMVDQYLREMTESLAEVREATAGVMAEERRCKKLVDENNAEMEKYEELARKALVAGNEADARVFLAKKQELAGRTEGLVVAYEGAKANADRSWPGAARGLSWPLRAPRPMPTKCARCTTSWWPISRS